jgi:hypothetical protein
MIEREFLCIAHLGEHNRVRSERTIVAHTPHAAAVEFARGHAGTVYSLYHERAQPGGRSTWRATWSESGLSIWLYEQ